MAKILRNCREYHEGQCRKLSIFIGQNSMFHHYYSQNIKDGIQIRVYKINNESVTHFSQFFCKDDEDVKKLSGN